MDDQERLAYAEVYRHKNTGGLYTVICNAQMVAGGDRVVVYRNLFSKQTWVRPETSFNDGRFERVQEKGGVT